MKIALSSTGTDLSVTIDGNAPPAAPLTSGTQSRQGELAKLQRQADALRR